MTRLGPKQTVASIDVDAQNGFTFVCPEELPVPEGEHIAIELNRQASLAQYRLGSKDSHPNNALWVADAANPVFSPIAGENIDVRWPVHCVPGTKGFELIEGLPHPSRYDYFVWKGVEPDMHPYGSCYHDLKETMSTGVIEFLRNRHVKTVLVGGLATDYCVKVTVLQLLKAGFRTILNLSACRGIAPETTEAAIREMRQKGAVIIHSLEELETEPEQHALHM